MVLMRWLSLICILLPLHLSAGPAEDMKIAAEALMKGIDDKQKEALMAPMNDKERENFRYTPRDRSGLFYKELDAKQREAVFALLKTAMSEKGLLKAKQVMMLEGILAKLVNRPEFRDPEKYWVAVFGTPGDAKGWGWKFEGHHLSLNFTIVGDKVALTPSFYGSNPGEVREGEHKGLRVLADEEDVAKDLVQALLKRGVKEVIYTDKPPKEILTKEKRKADPMKPEGISAAKMNQSEQAILFQLLEVYLHRYRQELAEDELQVIIKGGMDKLHFGWAGSLEKGEAWYYRVQGPSFLMEAANSQNDANHVHAVWRKFDGDFGRDILGDHFKDHDH